MLPQEKMRSYTSQSGWLGLLRQAAYLRRAHTTDIPGRVRRSIEDVRQVEMRLNEKFGVRLNGLDILEIGPGQYLSQMTYFGMHNRVTGIDLEVIAHGGGFATYARMLKVNGTRRIFKTLGRKLLGIDRRYNGELRRQLKLVGRRQHTILQMDASEMRFENDSFDFVYSRAVFHHLPDPTKAVKEVARVLRPGGVAYVALHPYTNPTGCLDPRVFGDELGPLGTWPHLRPESQASVRPNAYLNRLRIPQWRRLFETEVPEVHFILSTCDAKYIAEARVLQTLGKLTEFSLEELTTGEFVALWQKPPSSAGVGSRT